MLQAAPLADYRPELANAWVPVHQRIGAAARAAQMSPDVLSPPHPTWLLAKPIARLMRNDRPFYDLLLKMASTPERIGAGWWSQSQTHDYFIAEGQGHIHYWVYCERLTGAAESAALIFTWLV